MPISVPVHGDQDSKLMAITDSETSSCGVCGKQGGEVARGYDPGGLVTGEHQQAALVAGHKIICPAGLRQGQQEVVARVW